ncbi:hypothetical protein CRENBAI_010165 [Crenichthys baileyi]|uniref:Helicase C-terminal domain-containing protein n=1 Tax=Crenichthys baileyi TaxID=28760 RepID=A0AAV9RSM8_9TELE
MVRLMHTTLQTFQMKLLISESGKLVFLLALLERLREEGHRTLVFAHYRMVLDILERILGNRGFKVLRLDGTILQLRERERLISLFQTDKRYSVFLLTTQVGGVGLTLTAANRVVIYDPSWNPATDAQAVDRAYRIGQKKCSDLQADNLWKWRRRSTGGRFSKTPSSGQNTGDAKNPFGYFTDRKTERAFTLEDPRSSTPPASAAGSALQAQMDRPTLDEHIAKSLMHILGFLTTTSVFSRVNHDEDPEDQEEHHYINGRVQKAQELVKAESQLQVQLAESVASSTEPAWLRQPLDNNEHKKRQTIPKPGLSSPPPDRNFNVSPVVVDLDQSGSGGEEPHQNLSNEVIDLSADTSTELIGIGRFVPQLQISSDEKSDGPSRTSPSETNFNHITVPQNRRDSDLQQPESCSNVELSRLSPELEASHGSFNLELEDSNDVLDAADTEEEEQKLLSELQINSSFDVNKSLAESRSRWTVSSRRASNVDESINESIVTTKKKRAAVIYDSDEEEQQLRSPLSHSFQVLGSSTPKLSPPGSSTRRSRKSVGGNTSVVSHRSLLQSVIEDIDDQDVQDEDENDEDNGEKVSEVDSEPGETLHTEEEEEEVDNSAEDMKFNLEEEEDGGMETEEEEDHDVSDQPSAGGEDSRVGSTRDELQLEETSREEEEEEEGMKDHTESTNVASSEDLSSSLEELSSEPELTSGEPELTSGEPELTSGERMDQCAAKSSVESDSYESLVQRGKECYSQARLDDALSFFLRAIDIQPGDSEVQFMTIQLYRQLSQNR